MAKQNSKTCLFQEPAEINHCQDAVVDLEMDELNQHECMATLTGLIWHMHRNNITPKMEQVSCKYGIM